MGYLYVFLSAAAFVFASLLTKLSYDYGLTVWTYIFTNSIFGMIPLIYMAWTDPDRRLVPPAGMRKETFAFALLGAISAITFNMSLYHLPISHATILYFSYPIWAALAAWFLLRQQPTIRHAVAIILSLAGTALTVNLSVATLTGQNTVGIVLALVSGVLHAMYLVLGERVMDRISVVSATGATRLLMLISPVLLHPQMFGDLGAIPVTGWVISLVGALFTGVPAFLLLNRGIGLIGANRAAITSVVELPLALVAGLLLLREQIFPLQWVGAVLVIGAVLFSRRWSVA